MLYFKINIPETEILSASEDVPIKRTFVVTESDKVNIIAFKAPLNLLRIYCFPPEQQEIDALWSMVNNGKYAAFLKKKAGPIMSYAHDLSGLLLV